MITFSKRIEKDRYLSARTRVMLRSKSRLNQSKDEPENIFLTDSTRNRIGHLIKVSIQKEGLPLSFLRVNDEESGTFFLHENSLEDLCKAEIGNTVCDIINSKSLELVSDSINDFYLFDLIELLIVFSEDSKREKFTSSLGDIFEEEAMPFAIEEYMIVEKGPTTIWSLIPLLEDAKLKSKLEEYREDRASSNYLSMAKISSEILSRLTASSLSQDKTKSYAEQLTLDLANIWTTPKRKKELHSLFNEAVNNAKKTNNRIEDVRHLEKHTIRITNPNIYKYIAEKNMGIVELIITTLPERYVKHEDIKKIVDSYSKKYGIDLASGWIIRAPEKPINLEDIPF